jgi:hypothetical protein
MISVALRRAQQDGQEIVMIPRLQKEKVESCQLVFRLSPRKSTTLQALHQPLLACDLLLGF